MTDQLLVRVNEGARICSFSRSAMYAKVRSGEIPSVRIGHSVRIPIEALRELISKQTQTQPTEVPPLKVAGTRLNKRAAGRTKRR